MHNPFRTAQGAVNVRHVIIFSGSRQCLLRPVCAMEQDPPTEQYTN